MKNLLPQLQSMFSKEIKDFGITEVFMNNGELYTTSNYDLPVPLLWSMEATINNLKIS